MKRTNCEDLHYVIFSSLPHVLAS